MPGAQAINDAFLAWRNRLARIVSRIVPPHDVEDIVQETYVRACQFGATAEIKSPGVFMTKIVRHLALDYMKRAERRLTSQIDEELEAQLGAADESVDEPFQQVASGEEFAHFCEAVRQLPVQCRKVFVLKRVYGYAQRDIARELGITENIVEKLVAQGVHQCAHYMRRRQEAADSSTRVGELRLRSVRSRKGSRP